MTRKSPKSIASRGAKEQEAAEDLLEALGEYYDRSDADDENFKPEPIVATDPGMAGDVHRAFSAYRKSLPRRRLPPQLSKIRRSLFRASRQRRREAIDLAEMAATWLENEYDLNDGPERSIYPSPELYERDKWIYEQMKEGISFPELSSRLKKCAKERHWQIISSRRGIKGAAKRWAKYRNLEPVHFA